jgi:hypothetical protein
LNVSTCSFSTFANSFFVNKSSATNIYLFWPNSFDIRPYFFLWFWVCP